MTTTDDDRLVEAASKSKSRLPLILLGWGYFFVVALPCVVWYTDALLVTSPPDQHPWGPFAAAMVGTWLFYALFGFMGYYWEGFWRIAHAVIKLIGTTAALLVFPAVRATIWNGVAGGLTVLSYVLGYLTPLIVVAVIGVPIYIGIRRRLVNR